MQRLAGAVYVSSGYAPAFRVLQSVQRDLAQLGKGHWGIGRCPCAGGYSHVWLTRRCINISSDSASQQPDHPLEVLIRPLIRCAWSYKPAVTLHSPFNARSCVRPELAVLAVMVPGTHTLKQCDATLKNLHTGSTLQRLKVEMRSSAVQS